MRKILSILLKAGITYSIKKYRFNITKVIFLGYIITMEGVKADPEKIYPILE